jgi:hypothetical protein
MRHKQVEHPDRPYVRAIYDAQAIGFPIHDPTEFEAYRDWADANDPKTASSATTASKQEIRAAAVPLSAARGTHSRVHLFDRRARR